MENRSSRSRLASSVLICVVLGCEPGVPEPKPEPRRPPKAAEGVERTQIAKAARAPIAAPPPVARPQGPPDIEWPAKIRWQSWETGMAQAKAKGKPVCLLIYADWCPKCQALKPVFEDDAVAKLAGELVMIKQDSDDRPAWLAKDFGQFGGYVPRILFLSKDGKVLDELTSGNPRFPYFYVPQGVEVLKQNMRMAAGG